MKRFEARVYGKVQGVLYRINTEKKARELGLTGWVKNNADGTVSIQASGEEESLDKFITWLSEGTAASKVEKVSLVWMPLKEKEDQFFKIIY